MPTASRVICSSYTSPLANKLRKPADLDANGGDDDVVSMVREQCPNRRQVKDVVDCRKLSKGIIGHEVNPGREGRALSLYNIPMERLNKILAHAGIGSRRHCDDLILAGRVSVDGRKIRELGTRVDPEQQRISVDDQPIHGERLVYWLVHKPRGYLCTNHDPGGPAACRRPGAAGAPARLHRGPARREQRGIAAADQ